MEPTGEPALDPELWAGQAHESQHAWTLRLPAGVEMRGGTRAVAGAGEWLVAARSFLSGEQVLPWEAPLMHVHDGSPRGVQQRLAAWAALRGDEQLRRAALLCRPDPGAFPNDPHVVKAVQVAQAAAAVGREAKARLEAGALAWAFNAHAVGAGAAVYSVAAKVNHSCDPSMRFEAEALPPGAAAPPRLRHVATRALAAGEALSVSYIDVTCGGHAGLLPARARRRLLHRSKRFWCGCERCAAACERLDVYPCDACEGRASCGVCGRTEPYPGAADEAALEDEVLAQVERVAEAGRDAAAWAVGQGGAVLAALKAAHEAAVSRLGRSHWASQRLRYAHAEAMAMELHVVASVRAPERAGAAVALASEAVSHCDELLAWLTAEEGLGPPMVKDAGQLLRALHVAVASALLAVAAAEPGLLLHPDTLWCGSEAARLLAVLDAPLPEGLLLQRPLPPLSGAAREAAEGSLLLTAEGRRSGRLLALSGVAYICRPLPATPGACPAALRSCADALDAEGASGVSKLLVLPDERNRRLLLLVRSPEPSAVSAVEWAAAAAAGACSPAGASEGPHGVLEVALPEGLGAEAAVQAAVQAGHAFLVHAGVASGGGDGSSSSGDELYGEDCFHPEW